jgi:4-hydroxy-tetrahydrodipicolinate synthase
VGLSIDNVISLAAQARVIGIKDADTDLTRVIKIKTKLPDFKVLSSNVASLIGNLANGGDGIISVTANIAPSQMAELMRFWKSGDIKKVQVLNYPLVCLSEVLFSESNPIPVKYALYVKGLIDNELRKPLTKASDTTKNAIESITGKWKFF